MASDQNLRGPWAAWTSDDPPPFRPKKRPPGGKKGYTAAKPLKLETLYPVMAVVVICDDSEIEVSEGERCAICGRLLEEYDEVTGTGVLGYYHWTCVTHFE